MKAILLALAGLGCWSAAAVIGDASLARAGEAGRMLLRPFVLPFLWRSLDDAEHRGSPAEAFARGRALTDWLGPWSDGYLWVAWRWANEGAAAPGKDAGDHLRRLRAALVWLAEVQRQRPEVAVDLLVGTSFLVEMAARQDPGLAALLPSATAGLGKTAAEISDELLQAAERAGAGPTVREQRLFAMPGLLAVLWRRGDHQGAFALLDTAIARSATIRNQTLATEWRKTLQQLRAALSGDRSIDQQALLDDPRLAPLWPFLPQGK